MMQSRSFMNQPSHRKAATLRNWEKLSTDGCSHLLQRDAKKSVVCGKDRRDSTKPIAQPPSPPHGQACYGLEAATKCGLM